VLFLVMQIKMKQQDPSARFVLRASCFVLLRTNEKNSDTLQTVGWGDGKSKCIATFLVFVVREGLMCILFSFKHLPPPPPKS
jgi:hypothetical protein